MLGCAAFQQLWNEQRVSRYIMTFFLVLIGVFRVLTHVLWFLCATRLGFCISALNQSCLSQVD